MCVCVCVCQVSISHSVESGKTRGPVDNDSAVAMDFSDIGASPDLGSSCRNCHGSLREEGECVVCRVEVRSVRVCVCVCVVCEGYMARCGV